LPRAIVRRRQAPAALGDRPLVKAFGPGRGSQHAHRDPASGLAEYRHTMRIAAKLRDVVAHPLQSGDLVLEPGVARAVAALLAQFGVSQKTEGAYPVGNRHEHDALLGKVSAIV